MPLNQVRCHTLPIRRAPRRKGGSSAGLGEQQGDAIRNITGQFGEVAEGWNPTPASGATYYNGRQGNVFGENGSPNMFRVRFDASRVVPTAEENRPVNMAVRYLVRARP